MSELKIKVLFGQSILPYLTDLAYLRIKLFREYPYLYQGSMAYEQDYLQTYADTAESMMVLVLDDAQVVGASTALPLIFETPECQKPFIDKQIDINKVFYFGESLLSPPYRGKNIYRHFFYEREQAARQFGCNMATFCAVIRNERDPRKPSTYKSLEPVWKHFGYQPMIDMVAYFKWQEVHEDMETEKPMGFWSKLL